MSRTIAVHVRYQSLFISLPSSAKQKREMTNPTLSEERDLPCLFFFKFDFKFIEMPQIQFRDNL